MEEKIDFSLIIEQGSLKTSYLIVKVKDNQEGLREMWNMKTNIWIIVLNDLKEIQTELKAYSGEERTVCSKPLIECD